MNLGMKFMNESYITSTVLSPKILFFSIFLDLRTRFGRLLMSRFRSKELILVLKNSLSMNQLFKITYILPFS